MKVVTALALTLLLAGSAAAAAEKPAEESIRHLLEVMQARKVIEAMPQQLDGYFSAIMEKSLEGKTVSPQVQQGMDTMRAKLIELIRENFSWESMQGIYLEIYGKTFTQAEVDGMIKFYGSPVGHAVAVKLPIAMQNSMAVMQQRMQTLIPKIQEMVKETAAQAQPAAPHGAAPPPAGYDFLGGGGVVVRSIFALFMSSSV